MRSKALRKAHVQSVFQDNNPGSKKDVIKGRSLVRLLSENQVGDDEALTWRNRKKIGQISL